MTAAGPFQGAVGTPRAGGGPYTPPFAGWGVGGPQRPLWLQGGPAAFTQAG